MRDHTILIVDDEPMNINILMELLQDKYRLLAAKNGEQALARIEANHPDLILLDIMMPGMDGFEVCKRLRAKEETKDIPIIFVTAMNDELDETHGLSLGASDYLRKPISAAIVEARVRNQLALRDATQALKRQNETLEEMVQARTKELDMTRDITIHCMASLAETRDNETGNHIRRTQHYVKELAVAMRDHADFCAFLDDHMIDLLFKSAPLHDIGKVGVPDNILLKPGKLTHDEFEIMKQHAVQGRDAIVAAETAIRSGDEKGVTEFLVYAMEIAHGHHEKWDGTGYPQGQAGDEIPLSARLMAVADVYDALISARVYKPAFSHEKAVGIILEGRGKHFDPRVVDAFEQIQEKFREIARTFEDAPVDFQEAGPS